VLLAPPFICTAQDIDNIVSRLTDAIDGALHSIGVRAVS
jgi:adenosylmethionine-8-amino-7-oxononanoate aminotransferase